MKRAMLAICILFLLVPTSFAAKPAPPSFGTLASLKGTYAFQAHQTHYQEWTKTVSCPITTTVEMIWMEQLGEYWVGSIIDQYQDFRADGRGVTSEFEFGTIVADGAGHMSGSFTNHHKFNQAASNATVTITCGTPPPAIGCNHALCVFAWGPVSKNSGYPVYDDDVTITLTGTYTVEPDGSGMLGWVTDEWTSTSYMQIGGPPATPSGPWTTILLFGWNGHEANGECRDCRVGTAVLQK